ncbi:MAG TPA: penicillin acylase family protein [Cyclobacteriaceae bacterium]|nr:penicillin acylase family protein [Cyclobacteriaceae bacterium]
MKILKRIGIGIVVILVLLAAGIYLYLLSTKPIYSGELTLKGLNEEVEVMYDNYGVPHIYAQNASDAYFALGYVHAQDRLFQMEMLRRAAGGRLSEVLGEKLLPVDKLFRTLGLNQFAKDHASRYLSTDTSDFQDAALAYQLGINSFIANGKTPIEFLIAGIPKTEFKPEDIYLAVGFMSFGFAEGFKADPVLEKIRTELGEAYLSDLAVQTPPDAVRIKNFKGPVKTISADPLITSIGEAIEKIPVPLWSGSNGWVIDGAHTASGLPILANDTHIGFGQPAVWYEAHLEYPGFHFYGHHLAGVPFALLGNNHFAGWGLTMFENDDTDFFKETLNPENPNQVKFKEGWEELIIRDEVIKVKDGADVILKVKSSRHGPIINGIVENVSGDLPISLWWGLNHIDNQSLQAAYLLNHAERFDDAQRAAELFSSPGLNVMYGDVAGNIAWWAVAKLPIRPIGVNSKLFLDGASGKDEYTGYYDFPKNPQSINPPWGFVYSANNQPDSVDHVLYPGYYYPRSRSGRIVELLNVDKKWTLEEIKKVNLDVVSRMHPDIAKEIALVLKSLNNPEFNELVSSLESWEGDHQVADTAPSIYYNLLAQIMHLAMQDELGQTAYHSIMSTSIPKNSYQAFIRNNNSPWWDNVKTKDKKESRADIIRTAAVLTLELLHKTSGSSPKDWTWGKIHTLTHKHPLGAVKPLDKLFNVGPFAAPGGSEVINNLHFDIDTTGYFPVNGGPALRKITDFGDIENGETVSPTGQSGNVMSAFYDDEAEMFVTGKFRKMLMNPADISRLSENKLKMKPAKE